MLKVVRKNKAQIDKLLFRAKQEIIKEGKKMALEYVYSQVPTQEQIIAKFQELSEKNPQEAKEYYDKTVNLLEGIKQKLTSVLNKIISIQDKLDSVKSKMEFIQGINTVVSPFISTLEGIEVTTEGIVNVAGASPTAPPGPIATSATLKEKVKGSIQKMGSALKLASRIVTVTFVTYLRLKRKVDDTHIKITQLIDYINTILDTLNNLFMNILLPLLEDQDNISVDVADDIYSHYPGLEDHLNGSEGDLPSLLIE